MFPVINYVGRSKNLVDDPDHRKIHSNEISNLGGVGIYITFSLSLILFGLVLELSQTELIRMMALVGSTMILFFFGLKDDLVGLSATKKFIGQVFAASLVIFYSDIRILDMEGIFGLGQLSYSTSIIFTIFVFILLTNAYNLIDGIDGLAGTIAVIGSSLFGMFFMINGETLLGLVSFSLVGAMLGFLRFNLSVRRKIFMGDSGSLFIGFLLAWQSMAFLATNSLTTSEFRLPNAAILVLAVLCFPLLDTLRVFAIRIYKSQSPFRPDRNHIHHHLLNLGLNHIQSTFLIATCNIITIGFVYLLGDINNNIQLVLGLSISSCLFALPFMFSRKSYGRVQMLMKTWGLIAPPLIPAKERLSEGNDSYELGESSKIRVAYRHTNTSKSMDDNNTKVKDNEAPEVVSKRAEIFKKSVESSY
jgi:UDP-N-acetylmuramyl pentapeptide phosphotransferase/UDP-N-acetylglucosamine-1-phosphate transferase